jgi:hypothetical protein
MEVWKLTLEPWRLIMSCDGSLEPWRLTLDLLRGHLEAAKAHPGLLEARLEPWMLTLYSNCGVSDWSHGDLP